LFKEQFDPKKFKELAYKRLHEVYPTMNYRQKSATQEQSLALLQGVGSAIAKDAIETMKNAPDKSLRSLANQLPADAVPAVVGQAVEHVRPLLEGEEEARKKSKTSHDSSTTSSHSKPGLNG
jgi:hypothetical protein